MNFSEQFLKIALLGSDWVMIILILCSVLSVFIILDRMWYFFKMRCDFALFITELTDKLNKSDNVQLVAAWCSAKNFLEAQVASVGLEQLNIHSAKESMNALILANKIKLDKGLVILATLGNNTPFIGLFGTVIGIIKAFHALSTNKSAGPEVVMASISEALVATAVGILVAIPAVVAYNLSVRYIKKKISQSDTVAHTVLSYLNNKS